MSLEAALPVLVLAPAGRDGALAASIIEAAGLRTRVCGGLGELTNRLDGAGAAVVAEEAIVGSTVADLLAWVSSQPPWSDFPLCCSLAAATRLGRVVRLKGWRWGCATRQS